MLITRYIIRLADIYLIIGVPSKWFGDDLIHYAKHTFALYVMGQRVRHAIAPEQAWKAMLLMKPMGRSPTVRPRLDVFRQRDPDAILPPNDS